MTLRYAIAAAGVLLLLGGPAAAQDRPDPGAVRGSLSLGVGVLPDYEGSDDYRVLPLPSVRLHWRGFGLFTRGAGLYLDALPQGEFLAGPVVNYRFGRDDPDDHQVDALPDIDGAFEAGVFFGLSLSSGDDPRERLVPMITFLHDVSGEHEGYLVTGSLSNSFALMRPLTLDLGASITYASEDYQETYFGIDAAGAARSGLSAYDPGAGFQDVSLRATLDWSLSRAWSIGPTLIYKRLLHESADSPIVEDAGSANQFIGLVATTWRF